MARDTTPTDRRGYERPAIGDSWDDAWDALVEDLDKDVVETDTIANRPSSGEYDDELYYATDQEILYRWDANASDWVPAGTGTSSDPIPGTSHLESVSSDTIKGESSGATVYDDGSKTVGDGTTSADHESVSTGDAVINGTPENDPRELVAFVAEDSTDGFSTTIPDVGVPSAETTNQYILLEILFYEDDNSGSNNSLKLTLEGVGSGGYDYILHDENGVFDSRVTGQDAYELVSPTAANNSDRHFAEFKIVSDGAPRPSVSKRDASPLTRQEGKYLFNGPLSTSSTGDADYTLSADGDVRLKAAIWRVPNRGDI